MSIVSIMVDFITQQQSNYRTTQREHAAVISDANRSRQRLENASENVRSTVDDLLERMRKKPDGSSK